MSGTPTQNAVHAIRRLANNGKRHPATRQAMLGIADMAAGLTQPEMLPITDQYVDGLRFAADVVHAEARWQEELRRRGTEGAAYARDRAMQVEAAIRSLAAAVEPMPPISSTCGLPPDFDGLNKAEIARLARAYNRGFEGLCNAVADIIREHVGLVPVIPTSSLGGDDRG